MTAVRRWARRFAIGTLSLPVVGGCSLVAYVKYREATKPPPHVFEPLITPEGELRLRDGKYPPPTSWELLMRVFELLWIFIPVTILYYVMSLSPAWYESWLEMLLRAVERAGPAFVKCGQWSVTRRDLFPEQLRKVMEQLYSEVSQHPWPDSVRIIEEDLKQPLSALFDSIDPIPIGSGSIGQVHAAVLKSTKRRVVVKVMHPNVVETIAKDFWLINRLAAVVDRWFPSMGPYELPVQALSWTRHLAAQLDFRIEAEHLTLFRRNFEGTDYVEFPEPMGATQRVLIESYCKGEAATNDYLSSQPESVRDIIAGKGLSSFCKMMLRDNFLHGDLHPGNMLVDTSNPAKPVVNLIDVGLCQKLTDEEGARCNNLLSSFVHWKPEMCVQALMDMGHSQKFVDKKKFVDDTEELFQHYRPTTGEEEDVVSNILESMFDVMRVNRLSMDPTYVSIMWAVLVLEGFIMALNPEYNMVVHSAPWLVTEGHLSWSLVKNLTQAGMLTARRHLTDWWQGVVPIAHETGEFKPKRRPKFADRVGGKEFQVAVPQSAHS